METRANQPELLAKTLRDLTEANILGNIYLFNVFLPLILKGQAKKVVFLSSGLADPDFTREYDVMPGSLYGASKAAMNLLVAKYSAQYRKDGVLFLSLSPGLVDVGHHNDGMAHPMMGSLKMSGRVANEFHLPTVTPEQAPHLEGLLAAFVKYAPHFRGAITPEQSVTAMRLVIENASVEKGDGGDFLSHHGTKTWL
jgi:NAD(P)-dependent dehydrogenase (short-subunit alcohol dehydrogenase family)